VDQNVRVRFAPSPTGHLHVGGARTALYNFAFARRHSGTFVLRIDDTDPERSTDANTQAILRAMRWLRLDWDEGPEIDGDHGPYFQTQRSAAYEAALVRLKDSGAAYPCFCSSETLAQKREACRASGKGSGYDRTCRVLTTEESSERIAEGEPHVWRLRISDDRDEIRFVDAVRGETVFPGGAVDDFVLVRSDGTPTYNFATVIDDADMAISHVIRGDDHLSNTPKQILVYEALGASIPTFAHLSMIWGPDGKRLSKRHGATSVEAFQDEGVLPSALVNYLALLGWSLDDKTTMVTLEDLVANFSLERISSNPAVFDSEKLEWMNGVYIRQMPVEEFVTIMVHSLMDAELIQPGDKDYPEAWLMELAPLVSERVKRLNEIPDLVRFLFVDEVTPDDRARRKVLDKPGAGTALQAVLETLRNLSPWRPGPIEEALRELPERLSLKPRIVFQAVRVAISGSMISPPLFESLALLGRERSLARLEATTPHAET